MESKKVFKTSEVQSFFGTFATSDWYISDASDNSLENQHSPLYISDCSNGKDDVTNNRSKVDPLYVGYTSSRKKKCKSKRKIPQNRYKLSNIQIRKCSKDNSPNCSRENAPKAIDRISPRRKTPQSNIRSNQSISEHSVVENGSDVVNSSNISPWAKVQNVFHSLKQTPSRRSKNASISSGSSKFCKSGKNAEATQIEWSSSESDTNANELLKSARVNDASSISFQKDPSKEHNITIRANVSNVIHSLKQTRNRRSKNDSFSSGSSIFCKSFKNAEATQIEWSSSESDTNADEPFKSAQINCASSSFFQKDLSKVHNITNIANVSNVIHPLKQTPSCRSKKYSINSGTSKFCKTVKDAETIDWSSSERDKNRDEPLKSSHIIGASSISFQKDHSKDHNITNNADASNEQMSEFNITETSSIFTYSKNPKGKKFSPRQGGYLSQCMQALQIAKTGRKFLQYDKKFGLQIGTPLKVLQIEQTYGVTFATVQLEADEQRLLKLLIDSEMAKHVKVGSKLEAFFDANTKQYEIGENDAEIPIVIQPYKLLLL